MGHSLVGVRVDISKPLGVAFCATTCDV